MNLTTQPYKGTRDFYPAEFQKRQWIFENCAKTLKLYGFEQYDAPMLEAYELYAAKSGQELVSQQLYNLTDRGERNLAIRPEMTPSLARMVAAKLEEIPKPIRWFSVPNVWRYERPQKGRLREHWQLNVDILGGQNDLAELEILEIAGAIFENFGGRNFVKFRINHRGLMDEFYLERLGLSPELGIKLSKVLDAKEKMSVENFHQELEKLPLNNSQITKIDEFLNLNIQELSNKYPSQSTTHLQELFERLGALEWKDVYSFDPSIVRGLDYYTGIVFEAFDVSKENNRALFGGGRYDNLISLFHKNKSLSGVGFGMGDVVLGDFLDIHGLWPSFENSEKVFVSCPDKQMLPRVTQLSSSLRKLGFVTLSSLEPGSFKNQLKIADKFNSRWVILWGEDELKVGKIIVKDLKTGHQEAIEEAQVAKLLKNRL
jgi:histidyl-tRNA synthetase